MKPKVKNVNRDCGERGEGPGKDHERNKVK